MSDPVWTLWIADLHVGSAFSLLPEGFVGSVGVELGLNTGQEHLLRNYNLLVETVKRRTGGRIDVLGIVGDTIEGVNYKQEGAFISENDPHYQGRAALQLLKPLRNLANTVYMWQGSRYHVGKNSETEKWMAQELDAVPDPMGRPIWDWHPCLDVEGIIFDVAHHRSVTIVNRTMALEREIRFAYQVSDMKAMPHIILRAHDHVGCWIEVDGQCAVGLMPLKLQDHHARMGKWPNRWLTHWLGAWLIEIRPELLGTAAVPYRGHALRFKHPPPGRTTYRREGAKKETRLWRKLQNLVSH